MRCYFAVDGISVTSEVRQALENVHFCDKRVLENNFAEAPASALRGDPRQRLLHHWWWTNVQLFDVLEVDGALQSLWC